MEAFRVDVPEHIIDPDAFGREVVDRLMEMFQGHIETISFLADYKELVVFVTRC